MLDPDLQGLFIDKGNHEMYKKVTFKGNGDMVLGKTNFVWWNHLIGCEKTVSFTEFALQTIAALSKKQCNNTNILQQALVKRTIDEVMSKGNTNKMVDILFDAARYGVKSAISTEGFSITDNNSDNIKVSVTTRHRSLGNVILPGSGESVGEVVIIDDSR